MITYYILQDNVLQTTDVAAQAHWIHLCPPIEPNELETLSKREDIPLDFFVDSLDIDERSRYDREDESKLILLNTPVLNNELRDNQAIYVTVPIGIIVQDEVIYTVSQKDNPIIDRFLNQKVKGFDPLNQTKFILQIFQESVLLYLDALKKLNLKRNLIEQELYNSSRSSELKQLLRIEKSLVYFVNSLRANDLLMLKMKRTDFLKISGIEYYEDLFEDIIIDNGQSLEMSNVYTNILSGTMEAYASIISNNMNVFIHRLTIITIILMVPTLVASFYGMNLEHLPFSDSPFTFYFLILFSLLLGMFLIWFFRRAQRNIK